jgi:citrate lyase beta subunit
MTDQSGTITGVSEGHRFSEGLAELQHASAAVRTLHEGCCQPLRSPRMEALSATLDHARAALDGLDDDPADALRVIEQLEDAGAQLGYLQVACCAPSRIPLYTSALESLGKTQRHIKRVLQLEH